MDEVFRLGLELKAPDERPSVVDTRWALAGLEPSRALLTGSFTATDGEAVPYRLWTVKNPRALVLCLHGASDYAGAFDEIGPQFAARGIAALAIDQRGFGATASRGRWKGKPRMIRDAIEAVAFLRLRFGAEKPVFILGESMGAALAVHAAARAPYLDLAGVVLAAPGAVSGLWRRLFWSLVMRALHVFLPDSGLVMERITARSLTPASAIRLLCDPMVLRRIRPAMLFGLFEIAGSAVDEASHVHVPVLTMVGSREDVLREACIARLHHGLAGDKEWAFFRGGPHLLLHWKHNERVLAKVFGFIEARLTAAGSRV